MTTVPTHDPNFSFKSSALLELGVGAVLVDFGATSTALITSHVLLSSSGRASIPRQSGSRTETSRGLGLGVDGYSAVCIYARTHAHDQAKAGHLV
jgi:hypothetical protein